MGNSYAYLPGINDPADLRTLPVSALPLVCDELRTYLIEVITEVGGHFSANLGVVELTVALHYLFKTPDDKLIWDVGHQAYGHKVITGRREALYQIRQKGGISGFPNRSESAFDDFGTGHSSTSISAVLGMAEADLMRGGKHQHIAVIGDGSLTAGMSYEALNQLGTSKANVLVVVNDNQIGIDPNTGALSRHLYELGNHTASENVFRSLGIPYFGPVDGNDFDALFASLNEQVTLIGPRVLHVRTLKGKGYPPAEQEQTKWHATTRFVKLGGQDQASESKGIKYQDVFGNTLLELARKDTRIIGVTPAMPSGSGMLTLQREMPERVFDVGIAEQHAVTFSAGLALEGMKVFCNIYSSFMQRAYDQLIHDVALQNIPVVFCLDRAGVVGEDGPTHHGLFDLAYLKPIPNLIVAAPSNESELRNMMYSACESSTPYVIRYPKGPGPGASTEAPFEFIPSGKAKVLEVGKDVLLSGLGDAVNILREAASLLLQYNITSSVVDMRFLKPMDVDCLEELIPKHNLVLTLEDGVLCGGFGEGVAAFMKAHSLNQPLLTLGFPDAFPAHDSRDSIFHTYGMDAASVAKEVLKIFGAHF